ncbi:hypothetical protein IWQ62_001865 [Dispira parvispora]|uniref:Ribonuclease n=1 Tax=Dispira parvispora TaxID=1520584 RepID=A0A9W8ASL6_9FUNG|nr:hypothetical protein IWQ62_001865 [Dispira parvispora]
MLSSARLETRCFQREAELETREQELYTLGLPLGEPLLGSWTHHSPLPTLCTPTDNSTSTLSKVPCILGVDEAGRGPVLGPMVYGICYCPVAERERVASLGFADSKALTETQRDQLFDRLNQSDQGKASVGWAVRVLSPQDLSQAMLRRAKYNLNAIAHDTTMALIRETLQRGIHVTEVYVDTVGPPDKYQAKLSRAFPSIQFTVTKKADSLFPIVSAASICAKVVRDAVLRYWRFVEDALPLGDEDEFHQDLCSTQEPLVNQVPSESSWPKTFGSGYTSDPYTVDWLKKNLDPVFGYPNLIRFSWSTCTKRLEDDGVDVVWPPPDEPTAATLPSKTTRTRSTVAQSKLPISHAGTQGVFRHQRTSATASVIPDVGRSRLRNAKFFDDRHLRSVTAAVL